MTETESISPLALAFYGDAVYEEYVRRLLVMGGYSGKPERLHNAAVRKVCATYQAMALKVIEPMLTEDEKDAVRRGRNASGIKAPKNADVLTYRHATALETLMGYLAVNDNKFRIEELMSTIISIDETQKGCNE